MPPHICYIWERPILWKDAHLLVLPTYWARVQRVKTAIYGGGMGRFSASPKGIGQN